jgi:hypothetical protein
MLRPYGFEVLKMKMDIFHTHSFRFIAKVKHYLVDAATIFAIRISRCCAKSYV